MRIVINGFGRIGRTVLRQILANGADIEVALINDIAPLETCAYLFAYDSTFGPYDGQVSGHGTNLNVDGHAIPFSNSPDLSQLDLNGVDVVMECTGIARTTDVARRGLSAGAKSVLISGPSPAADVTVVLGGNEHQLGDARIISNASCTTNGVVPLVKALNDQFGIDRAHMTTIHCYTNSQPMVDAPRGDLARSRAGALSMVPTTTSATQLLTEILPQLQGKISGAAVRVPAASVSGVDLVAQLATDVDPDGFTAELKQLATQSHVLGWTDLPLVSSDLRKRPESLVLALPETQVTGTRQVRIYGWYDNEWGFSARMIDMARIMAQRP